MGYDTTMKALLLFVIVVNISLYWVSISGVLPVDFSEPDNPDSFVTDPSTIENMLISVDLSTGNLALGAIELTIFGILGWLTGNLVLGATVGVALFAFTLISPVIGWLLFGLPRFMSLMGVPPYISAGVMALIAVPLFFTVISFIAQRPIEGHG